MKFKFSYIGVIFLLMLIIPNIIWSDNKPKDYEKYVENEDKILSILEKIGQVAFVISVFFLDFNINGGSYRLILLFVAFVLMILYEIYWIRYFKSEKTMKDMYRSVLGIPAAGATLPVLAFLLLGVCCENISFVILTIILGIVHIGIRLNHQREVQ